MDSFLCHPPAPVVSSQIIVVFIVARVEGIGEGGILGGFDGGDWGVRPGPEGWRRGIRNSGRVGVSVVVCLNLSR